jgi:hypothetical protein
VCVCVCVFVCVCRYINIANLELRQQQNVGELRFKVLSYTKLKTATKLKNIGELRFKILYFVSKYHSQSGVQRSSMNSTLWEIIIYIGNYYFQALVKDNMRPA